MRNPIIVGLLVLLATPASAGDELERLASLQQGLFDTAAINPDLPSDQRLAEKRQRIIAPQLGEYVFYQQINHRADLTVYRQRILILRLDPDNGLIEQTGFALATPELFVDAPAESFSSLAPDDLKDVLPSGCELFWSEIDDGFKGHVDPEHCIIVSSRTGKHRRIEAESILTSGSLLLSERGFDAETREQLFGTKPGEYLRLGRVR